jgi:hypothetical protein
VEVSDAIRVLSEVPKLDGSSLVALRATSMLIGNPRHRVGALPRAGHRDRGSWR